MKDSQSILLPGLDKQISFLLDNLEVIPHNILIMGSSSADIARRLNKNESKVTIAVEDHGSLLNTKLELEKKVGIEVKLMDFERTDFSDNELDLIFAQGSISNFRRKKIIKELKRICRSKGVICIGELVKIKERVPPFVDDLFTASDLDPLYSEKLEDYYRERDWDVIKTADLSFTLKPYYQKIHKIFRSKADNLSMHEKSFHKKFLNRLNHESNAYLKLGADKYIGFKALLLKKK